MPRNLRTWNVVALLFQYYLVGNNPFCRAFLALPTSSSFNGQRSGASGASGVLPQQDSSVGQLFNAIPARASSLFGSKSLEAESVEEGEDKDDMFSMEKFQNAKEQSNNSKEKEGAIDTEVDEGFDGYQLRDIILKKWGQCYDMDFNRVDTLGFKSVYLNVMPFCLGRRPFRHDTELDYLCHLQAVVEILQKYEQLEYVLYQIQDTKKKPRPGTVPLVAVPLRLDLTPDEVKLILSPS